MIFCYIHQIEIKFTLKFIKIFVFSLYIHNKNTIVNITYTVKTINNNLRHKIIFKRVHTLFRKIQITPNFLKSIIRKHVLFLQKSIVNKLLKNLLKLSL